MTNEERMGALFEEYAQTRAIHIRDELVEGYLPLAKAVARRFEGRGIETEDLQQVASMALLKAVERFDLSRGFRFVTYAVPTIAGDVRNYIRDKTGGMRMPRDLRKNCIICNKYANSLNWTICASLRPGNSPRRCTSRPMNC